MRLAGGVKVILFKLFIVIVYCTVHTYIFTGI